MRLIYLIFSLLNAQAANTSGLSVFSSIPDCEIEKNYLYLTKKQSKTILKGFPNSKAQRIIRRYDLNCLGKMKKGYVLSDKVRTHFQKVLIVIEEDKVSNIEVLKFDEPLKYKSPVKWLDYMFKNKKITSLNVDAISGATLTTKSMLRIVRKAMFINNL